MHSNTMVYSDMDLVFSNTVIPSTELRKDCGTIISGESYMHDSHKFG